ncbi:MAG: hypothetical protein MJ065_04685 [Oscillospiraceae bacterium]|nr:hypothetical protein [Oscillospiraceae bacterium]
MKKIRLFAMAAAMLLSACAVTACGEQSSVTEDQAEEDMPYGATVVENRSGDYTLCYDRRFLDDALIDMIRKYYLSLQEKDGEAFSKLMFPLYHQYQLEEFYAGELTDQDIVEQTHDAIAKYYDIDFAYSYIDIKSLIDTDSQSQERDSLLPMLDNLAAEKDLPKISEGTTKLYEMTIDRYIGEREKTDKNPTDIVLQDEKLYAIKYEEQWYLIYL